MDLQAPKNVSALTLITGFRNSHGPASGKHTCPFSVAAGLHQVGTIYF